MKTQLPQLQPPVVSRKISNAEIHLQPQQQEAEVKQDLQPQYLCALIYIRITWEVWDSFIPPEAYIRACIVMLCNNTGGISWNKHKSWFFS